MMTMYKFLKNPFYLTTFDGTDVLGQKCVLKPQWKHLQERHVLTPSWDNPPTYNMFLIPS